MRILHSEASPGWGGQEIRTLKEALGMRARGHEVFFAIIKGGPLAKAARKEGFTVYELAFKKRSLIQSLWLYYRILKRHQIDIINTHTSLDAWIGGFLGKVLGIPTIRTRHLSTAVRGGINARLLYNFFADYVVTTCQEVVPIITQQAHLPLNRCQSIPTGVDVQEFEINEAEVKAFREKYEIADDEVLAGTLCFLRTWKGVADLLHAAHLTMDHPKLRWIVIGGGVDQDYFLKIRQELGLEKRVIFTGYLAQPQIALAALDIFLLLSFGHEGVSQASLQAAWLKKPLITTSIGGLKEVCLDGITGKIVPTHSPEAVAKATLELAHNAEMRKQMGERGHQLVLERFTSEKMLDQLEAIYKSLL